MKNNLLLLIISIWFIGCNPEIFNPKPIACFDYSPTNNLKTTDSIKFSNCSENSNYYYWDFGDGYYSHEKEPKHLFPKKQTYSVKLIVSKFSPDEYTNIQESDTIIRLIDISIGVPKANYWYENIVGSKIAFFNISEYGDNCLWDFGDNSISTEKNPVHTYITNGSYKVKLKISNDSEIDSISETIEINDTVDLKNTKVRNNNIDCDGDGIPDLNFNAFAMITTSGSSYWAQIKPLNDFEIFTDTTTSISKNFTSTDTTTTTKIVSIPKIYVIGDTISHLTSCTKSELRFADASSNYGYSYSSGYTKWIKDEIRYIGFRKVINDKIIIGWVKLKVLTFDKVILISYRNPYETEKLVIDK